MRGQDKARLRRWHLAGATRLVCCDEQRVAFPQALLERSRFGLCQRRYLSGGHGARASVWFSWRFCQPVVPSAVCRWEKNQLEAHQILRLCSPDRFLVNVCRLVADIRAAMGDHQRSRHILLFPELVFLPGDELNTWISYLMAISFRSA